MIRTTDALRGMRVLVAEDEFIIADELAEVLKEWGAEVVGPVPTLAATLVLVGRERLDGAVLDVNLAGQMVWPAAEALASLGVPVVLATGHGWEMIPPAHAHLPRCEKPLAAEAVVRILVRRLTMEGT